MSLKTYQINLNGRTVRIKMRKTDAEKLVSYHLQPIVRLTQYARELRGVRGVNETSHTFMSVFGPGGGKMVDPDGWARDRDAFFAALPELITEDNAAGIIAQADTIYKTHLPIIDKRQTPDQAAAEQAERDRIAAEANAAAQRQHAAILTAVGSPGTIVTVDPAAAEGKMAVMAQLTHDDSDSQSDYFHPHASIGPRFLLALVPKGAQREDLARAIIARYPELDRLEWKWHSERYSMGHGNYLQSSTLDFTLDAKTYYARGATEQIRPRWEIQFDTYRLAADWYVYPGYPGLLAPVTATAGTTQAHHHAAGISVAENERHDGVEIRFCAKPDPELIARIKGMGFRWSFRQRVWYARRNAARLEFAYGLVKPAEEPAPAVAEPGSGPTAPLLLPMLPTPVETMAQAA